MAGNQAEAAHSEAQANVADSKPQARPAPRIEEAAMRQVDIPADVDAPPEYGPSLTYAQTSQARSWRFSAEQIAHMRETGNQAARRRLERLWNEERVSAPFSTSYQDNRLTHDYSPKLRLRQPRRSPSFQSRTNSPC